MIKTQILADGVTLRCFYDSRFKQGSLSVQFVRPMAEVEASLNALLPMVLLRGSRNHPDLRAISLRMDDLYGLSVGTTVRRVGDYQTTGLGCGVMDDRFALPGDKILEPALDFLRELLLEPALEDGVFRADYVESEKKNLLSTLAANRNDKQAYAMTSLLGDMCRADSLGIPRLGKPEWVRAITPRSLYDHYRRILRESPVHIFYVGSAPDWQVAAMLRPLVEALERRVQPLPGQSGFHDAGGGEREERMDVAQAKLCMGYVTPINNTSPDFYAMQVMNTVFGGGMTSKLFMNVREKLSLCYSIGTGYYGSKGIVTLSAGVDAENIGLAKAEIAAQLEAVCRGEITADELSAAKEALISSLRGTHDSPGAIEGYYATAALSGLDLTPAAYMERIAAVTADQVAAAARQLKLHTTYVLKGAENGKN